jgi:hypothetical protein
MVFVFVFSVSCNRIPVNHALTYVMVFIPGQQLLSMLHRAEGVGDLTAIGSRVLLLGCPNAC